MDAKQQSILIGGVVVGLLQTSFLGLINCLCCAGIILGGMAAVWHYTSTHELTISQGEGASMGALAGVVGALIAFVLNLIAEQMGFGVQGLMQEFFLENFADSMDDEQYEEMQRQFESSEGFSVVNLLGGVLVSTVFATIGGVIGASVFKKGPEDELDDF